jgi:hypothetical protein
MIVPNFCTFISRVPLQHPIMMKADADSAPQVLIYLGSRGGGALVLIMRIPSLELTPFQNFQSLLAIT